MNNLEIKRGWLPAELTLELSSLCYQIAVGEFHKQNLLKLLTGVAGPAQAAISRQIVHLFWKTPIPKYYEDLHQDPCALWLDFTTLRYHTTGRSATFVPWHFDFNFFSNDKRGLIAWVPFDTVGVTAPGLEFCFPRHRIPNENFVNVFKNGVPPATLDDEALELLFGPDNQQRFSPEVGAGDVIFFDAYTLHRTQPLPRATTSRLAIEFRMTSATAPSERLRSEPKSGLSYLDEDGAVAARSAAELYGF